MGVMILVGLNMWVLDRHAVVLDTGLNMRALGRSVVCLELGADFWVWKIYSSPLGMLMMKFGNVMYRFPESKNMVWPGDRV